jgi:hypothetical protein
LIAVATIRLPFIHAQPYVIPMVEPISSLPVPSRVASKYRPELLWWCCRKCSDGLRTAAQTYILEQLAQGDEVIQLDFLVALGLECVWRRFMFVKGPFNPIVFDE